MDRGAIEAMPTGQFQLTALLADSIIETSTGYANHPLLQCGTNTMREMRPDLGMITTENFQQRMGGRLELLLGQDVKDMHPLDLVQIHDGFYITKL